LADDTVAVVAMVVGLAILLLILLRTVHTIPPYQQGVVTLFGSDRRTLNPGFNFASPLAMVLRVDLRSRQETLPMTVYPAASGPVRLSATVTYRVVDAPRSGFPVRDLAGALVEKAKLGLADALSADATLAVDPGHSRLAAAVADRMQSSCSPFGVRIETVTLADESSGSRQPIG
jgi:regulator of protease activity HflC (stomatin/prohibitin superfamily)